MAARKSPAYFTTSLLCGLIGAILASWVAPKVIAWYFEPPVDIGLNCRPATEWSMSRMRICQFIGLVLGLVGGFVMSVRSGREPDEPLP